MNTKKTCLENIDIAIASVRVDTELPALLATFGIKPGSSPEEIVNDVRVWRPQLIKKSGAPLNVALTYLGETGNLAAITETQRILTATKPRSIYLVGTAAGRRDRTSICDVVVSSDAVMYYESGHRRDIGIGDRPKYYNPNPSTRKEVESFFTTRMKALGWQDEYTSIIQEYRQYDKSLLLPEREPHIHFNRIASGERLLEEGTLESICKYDDLIRAGEMEGYGFAHACKEAGIDWLVIRGISDFGNREDRNKWATVATIMVCSFLKIFLTRTEMPEKLQQGNIYVREKIPNIMRRILKEQSLDITAVKFVLDLTISELESICHLRYPERSLEEIRKIVRQARAAAFEYKYADRTEQDDERYTDIRRWKGELQSLLSYLDILDTNAKKVINVGIGNGLEAKGLFDNIEEFIGVDISGKALTKAQERCPKMKPIITDAEDLWDVENQSQELYISLRTYQSTLFDIKTALLEAYRILKPGGTILISIPYVFVEESGRVVKGLLKPETDEVDSELPWDLTNKIRSTLDRFNFNNTGIRTGMVEIYIYGKRG